MLEALQTHAERFSIEGEALTDNAFVHPELRSGVEVLAERSGPVALGPAHHAGARRRREFQTNKIVDAREHPERIGDELMVMNVKEAVLANPRARFHHALHADGLMLDDARAEIGGRRQRERSWRIEARE